MKKLSWKCNPDIKCWHYRYTNFQHVTFVFIYYVYYGMIISMAEGKRHKWSYLRSSGCMMAFLSESWSVFIIVYHIDGILGMLFSCVLAYIVVKFICLSNVSCYWFLFDRLDIYRKIPKDLTEPTYSGACISIISCLFMAFLFFSELASFLSVEM